jgi:hypothetical protein
MTKLKPKAKLDNTIHVTHNNKRARKVLTNLNTMIDMSVTSILSDVQSVTIVESSTKTKEIIV